MARIMRNLTETNRHTALFIDAEAAVRRRPSDRGAFPAPDILSIVEAAMGTAHCLRRAARLCALLTPSPLYAQQDHARHSHPPEHAQLHADFYQKLQRPDVPAD